MMLKRINLALLFVALLLCSYKQKTLTWVAIGDSITYLNDHTNETGNRVTRGYLNDVTDHFDNLTYINKGYNGWTSGNIAQRINTLGLVKADVYTVFLGTNDWWQGRPVGKIDDYINNTGNNTISGSFRIIIDKLHELNPKAKIVLITPLQRADFVYINSYKNNAYGSYKPKNGQELSAVVDAISAIGKYADVPVIDLYHDKDLAFDQLINFKRLKDPATGEYKNYKYPEAADVPFNPATDEYPYPTDAINLTYDGLHPSDKGNLVIAGRVINQFKNLRFGIKYNPTPNIQRWKGYIDLDAYLKPFWKTDTITDETVLPIQGLNGPSARLMYVAKKIIAVKTADNSAKFIEHQDWEYSNGELKATSPNIPFMRADELISNEKKTGYELPGKTPGSYVRFSEGSFWASKQLSVTYIKDAADVWMGPVPQFADKDLPETIGKLQKGKHLKIVFYGNSIEVGHNASGFENAPPFMPSWAEMLIYQLKKTYGKNIEYANRSVSGRLAKWGADSVMAKVNPEKPDLVIIGFGMNDGTAKVAPEVYRQQIQSIIDAVSQQNKHAEFILIAPMLANPNSAFDGLQSSYKAELDKLTHKGIIVADITGVHQELLKHKTYQDMTGNNVNHPNDYLARWYAQFICGLLINK